MQATRAGIDHTLVTPIDAAQESTPSSWREAQVPEPFGPLQYSPLHGAQAVWVRAAVTGDTQARSAPQAEEWALELTIAGDDLVLSFLMPDGAVQSVRLKASDAQDLGLALRRLEQAPIHALN